ncbi:MAG: glycosyltransferase family 2 protein [Kiritimatiellae bacterium]|nr:glycosyltransferase family 2 protein [Kiritimatiellia bacterium]MCG2819448.1 glycosyltransferase family 2 protein [Actinomycetes bacterium]
MRDKISACLTVGNEENNIRRCLDSLFWVDEIVVVDSFSKDHTVEICRQYTERVYQHEWLGYVGQKELIKKMATHPWIMFIDADEQVSPELRDEILREFESGGNREYDGYEFPRKVFFLGQWITHGEWWPDLKMRLYRKDKGLCTGREPHDHVLVTGPVKRLKGCLNHYTYDDLSDQIMTQNRFSTISSQCLIKEQRHFSGIDLIFRPLFRFFKGYILKQGFLDGYRGFIISALIAMGVFLKYAKLWELTFIHKPPPDSRANQKIIPNVPQN